MLSLLQGLDKPALLITAMYLSLYLVRKNRVAFILSAELLLLSNWYLFIPDSYATVMVFDCLSTIVSGSALYYLYKSNKNLILIISQLLLFLFSTSAYIIGALYYYYKSQLFYNLAVSIGGFYVYIFWPFLALNVIGLLYIKGSDNGGNKSGNSYNVVRCFSESSDICYSGHMGYHERRY